MKNFNAGKSPPRRAFVLAAGLGTRMRPLTTALPKPLLPFWGRPLLFSLLDRLQRWGVREVLINLHHQPDIIRTVVAAEGFRGLDITYSHEPVILGTGGALVRARAFLDQPFWMVNADIAFDLDPVPLLARHARGRPLATCWLHGSRGPRTVEMQRGLITNFRSKRAATPGTYTFCGLQLLEPRILDFLPREEQFITIVDAYEAGRRAGEKIAGVDVPDAFWADLGTPAQYLRAHAEARPVGRGPWRALGREVKIAAGATVENSVLWDGAQVARGAVVRDAIVGCDARVTGAVSGIALRIGDGLEPVEQALLKRAKWPATALARPLGARGSARSFTRVQDAERSAILIHYSPERHENTLYALHARFLARCGFPVPRVLADDPRGCVTLLEDLGDASVLNTWRGAEPAAQRAGYRKVLDAVLTLHGKATRAAVQQRIELGPAFRPRLYRWEREYFAEHMLQKRLGLDAAKVAAVLRELCGIGRLLLRAPPVLVHRDLQSSNVILQGGRPYFIDFQGMRLGPAVYDLASLLADPYMELDEAVQVDLLDYYAQRAGDAAAIHALFWPAVVQRLAQALGAFARLGAQRDTASFAQHIDPAWRMMARALAHLRGRPALRAVVGVVAPP